MALVPSHHDCLLSVTIVVIKSMLLNMSRENLPEALKRIKEVKVPEKDYPGRQTPVPLNKPEQPLEDKGHTIIEDDI